MTNQDKWFFAWFVPDPDEPEGQKKGILTKKAKWLTGETIKVSFLDGDAATKGMVKKYASVWTGPGMANLKLDFVDDISKADIRVSFAYEGSWSVIGNNCRNIKDKNKPTINFGWLKANTPDDQARRVVLHEFGHAMGLIHEHQNPTSGIKWNKKAIYEDLSKPPNNWDTAKIDHNMFEIYNKNDSNFTQYDPRSIMIYSIPAKWTLDGYSVDLNKDLSPMDKQFIRDQYPTQ